MSSTDSINLAVSADAKGFKRLATVVASILRRTKRPVHVKCWCRGRFFRSFEHGRLRAEFHEVEECQGGNYPSHVTSSVFDRLRVIEAAENWSRCLVMDYDQLAFTDLWPMYSMDFGGKLLAARLQGTGIDLGYAMNKWRRQPFPEGWEHTAGYPYFTMGPLLNLDAMRQAGTWKKLMDAHRAFGADEQLALTAATEGSTIGFERRWNLFPDVDRLDQEIPQGIVHWTGVSKPWHAIHGVWRPDLWESEEVSWMQLKEGIWEKPLAVTAGTSGAIVGALARRGWKVLRMVEAPESRLAKGAIDLLSAKGPVIREESSSDSCPAYPDVLDINAANACAWAESLGGEPFTVRIGPKTQAAGFLRALPISPDHIVMEGPRSATEVHQIRQSGYRLSCLVQRSRWAHGGPSPDVLEYSANAIDCAVGPDEDLYLAHH
jgi:lipopolysaccharide biosynthesis glycosyltransferase